MRHPRYTFRPHLEENLQIGRDGWCLLGTNPYRSTTVANGGLQRRPTMSQVPSLILDQLNSTALKWGSDGELSPLDHQRILQLLCQADPVAESLIEGFDGQAAFETRQG